MAYTSTDLAAIDAAIASGERRVKFSDREVEYRSMDDLLRARAHIQADLDSSSGATDRRLSPRYKVASFI